MEDYLKKGEVNSSSISGKRLNTASKIYVVENTLTGHKPIQPVSVAMQQYIKSEFSKIKL